MNQSNGSYYAGGYVVLATGKLSRTEWFLMDLVEETIGLPIRLVKWHRRFAHPSQWLYPRDWKALIISFEGLQLYRSGGGMGSADIGPGLEDLADLLGTVIRLSDIDDMNGFVQKLKDRSLAMSKHLFDDFFRNDLLDRWPESGHPSETFKEALINELNRLIREDQLYRMEKIIKASSRPLRQLIKQRCYHGDYIRANLLALAGSYPQHMRKIQKKAEKHVYLLLRPQQIQDTEMISNIGFPMSYCFESNQKDDEMDLAKRMCSDLKDWTRAKGDSTHPSYGMEGRINWIRDRSEKQFHHAQGMATALVQCQMPVNNMVKLAKLRSALRKASSSKDPDGNETVAGLTRHFSQLRNHFVPVIHNTDSSPTAVLGNVLKALSYYGRVPLSINMGESSVCKELVPRHDPAILLHSGADSDQLTFPQADDYMPTRLYLFHNTELQTGVMERVEPIVSWELGNGLGEYIEEPGPASGRSPSGGSGVHYYQQLVPLFIRDIYSHCGDYPIWRRVCRFAEVPPMELCSKVEHMIVTALKKERDAVLNSEYVKHYETLDTDQGELYMAYIEDGAHKLHPFIVGCITEAGRLPAALFAHKAITTWNPNYVMMVGIAGSLAKLPENEPIKGDLVIASDTIDYEYRKITDAREEPRPEQEPCDLLPRVESSGIHESLNWRTAGVCEEAEDALKKELWERFDWITESRSKTALGKMVSREIGSAFDGDSSSTSQDKPFGKIHIGIICTGEKVVASEGYKELILGWLETMAPKVRAVEMEGAAVKRAIDLLSEESKVPKFIVIRGISDDATRTKSDAWHSVAAKYAADFALRFLQWDIMDAS